MNRFRTILSRLQRLEPEPVIICPYCATEAMTKEDLDKRIKEYVDLFEGKIDEVSFSDLPPPHPYCPKCRRTAAKFASMTEDELDAKLAA